MNAYRTNLMRTPSSFAKSLSALGAVAVLLGSSAVTLAAEPPVEPDAAASSSAPTTAATPAQAAAKNGTASATAKNGTAPAAAKNGASPAAEASSTTAASDPKTPATPVAEEAPPITPAEPETDPPSITEIGIQRLPGSAFPSPQTRGIAYGSMSLGFHGLQWPYMPARGSGSRFVLGLSGWGWVDTSYEKFGPWGENPQIDKSRLKYWIQQARLVLRATPTYSLGNGWFVQGQAEFVATEDQTIDRSKTGGADTDDLWLRIGEWNKWDFQIGRYEGWEVFHLGMGLDLNTFERKGAYGEGDVYNPVFYGVTDNQYRPQGAAGNAAFHYYPLPYLRFELLSTLGSLGSSPVYSARPVAILDLGWLKLKAAAEYQKATGQQADDRTDETRKGVGGGIQFVFLPHLEFGFNAAQGTAWVVKGDGSFNPKASFSRTSFGGFANLSNGSRKYPVVLGVGSIYTKYEDQFLKAGLVNEYWQLQNFVAVQYVAFGQLYIKLVGGYARGHWDTAEPLSYDDEMYSVRLRFALYF
jgi:hypothetical protein